VIRSDRDPQAVRKREQNELDLAARMIAEHLDRPGVGEKIGGHTVEDRRALRPLDAERFEFVDMLLQRFGVASGPPGDHQPFDIIWVDGSFLRQRSLPSSA
jgi:hypothetical protein